MTVNEKEFYEDLNKFCRKHGKNRECKIYTSPMENDSYHKEYCFEDGANFYVATDTIVDTVEIEARGFTFNIDVKFWRTEYWSTEFGSKYFYQKY